MIVKDPDSQGKEGSLAREGDSNGHQASFQTDRQRGREGTVRRVGGGAGE